MDLSLLFMQRPRYAGPARLAVRRAPVGARVASQRCPVLPLEQMLLFGSDVISAITRKPIKGFVSACVMPRRAIERISMVASLPIIIRFLACLAPPAISFPGS